MSFWSHHRQAVGRRVNGGAFTTHGATEGVHYRLCLRIVAMVDKNGVPIAQEAHVTILKRFGCLDPEETLRFGQSFPLSRVIQRA